ncbi:ADP-ribosyl-(dinitrogen reductase) hydrolase [Desulfurispirillum indicum S5]|uniref:ADP-ribosyl-(Dinitrogen reductase) hydrolase n=1 Tax=Desulfurispirillum indicum (strain ATCC BAA-1389 / DSM 22839 / S5) TaxID=653733 RepID=E6W6L4_DESIS|nr:ADP-ribosyl-[dinitrogen reductase] hydrolase [Desulfurispirillum indicum]ADU65014.1 ADP-ribosyl-(dinitrogen reductase) hydrolase [Desulfurispirillum indicum S5]
MGKMVHTRALGAYLGFAIGDAMGATTEFMTPREIESRYGTLKQIVGGGWLGVKPGQVTDDTQMSLSLGQSIIDGGGFSLPRVADGFVQWMRSKPIDIGSTVRRGIREYMLQGQLESAESEFSAGNGGLMRNFPIALYCLKDWQHFAPMTLRQCHFTHNNFIADEITLMFGEVTRCLLETGDKLAALKLVSRFIIEHPKYSYSRYKGENSGYIVHTFKCIMHHFFDSTSFEETIIRVVNQGGDADTNAAIAGILAGALYGVDSIPRRWRKKLDRAIAHEIHLQTDALLELPCVMLDDARTADRASG